MRQRILSLLLVLLGLLAAGCKPQHQPAASSALPPRTTVLWISIDGLRWDYIDRAPTPFFHKLMAEGAYSRQLTTITPSLTFPSHVSEATGVPASMHGIPANDFYDMATHRSYNFPSSAAMLESEPIWLAAQRQGIRTLVYNWPLSMQQAGPVRCDYFLPKFESGVSDEQRLQHVLDTWDADANPQPLGLVMGYIVGTDHVGHQYGPDSPEIAAKIQEVDSELQHMLDRAMSIVRRKMGPQDQFYLILTTDHGMAPVHTLVNFEKLFERPPPHHVRLVTSGPLGMVSVDPPATQPAQFVDDLYAQLKRHDFLRVYLNKPIVGKGFPGDWQFVHPTRTGDIIVMLKPGYTFSTRLPLATFPVGKGEKVDQPLGMHGYPPKESPEMRGLVIFWRYPKPLGPNDLGLVHVFHLHPTVASLLGIAPAPNARAAPLKLEP
jgi:predicted AlkP superfamily pyrophosphatase or phosphodiesterase